MKFLANNERLKLILASVLAFGATLFLLSTMMPEQFEGLFGKSEETFEVENSPGQPDTSLANKKSKKPMLQKSMDDDAGPLNLESGVALESLNEELIEDSLWEDGITRARPEGVRSGQAVLEAINEIEGWSPIENGYNPSRLRMFLRYPKLWVRLSAFAFAIKAKILSQNEEEKLARLITLRHRENPAQIKRFLMRYERKDTALFQQLSKRLIRPVAPPPQKVTPLEVEEDNTDAS